METDKIVLDLNRRFAAPLPEFYERVKHGVELTVFGLKRANDNQLPIYEKILSDLIQMEESIYGNRS